ncbi:PAS domain S-box protein [Methylobrevis albus]|uniref:histidine kinase n=1 Tax=Methylobrevis albus TaxID=2793297 RepID=A0A931MXY7_9HYPH|nr:PAS domain S-box protein [Methylobrevis albus]MBH0239798.1 PAS domain S-box protein [Methylobrevis albus]
MIARLDWTTTPLGAFGSWSPALRTTVGLMLGSRAQIVMFWGPDYVALYNDAYAPTIGNKHPRALGRPAAENWSELWDDLEPLLRQVRETGETFHAKDRPFYIERHGYPETVYFDISYSAVFDETDAVAGVLCIVSETTERVIGERLVRESEKRFRTMANQAPVMMWLTNATGYCEYLNRLWYDYTGQTEADALGFGWLEATHPDDKQMAADIFLAANAAHRPFRIEYRIRRADGAYRWAIDAGAPRHSETGEFLGYIGSVVDIDERHEAERQARESEARFQAIANSIDQMVWSTRPDGFHDYYNARWYEFTGVPPGSTDGEGWNGLFHPDDQERAWTVWRHSLRTGAPYHIEYRLRHHSGVYRWVLGRAQAVRDADGRITRWFGSCTDIQDIVDAREVLARSREELELEIERRTARLLEAEGAMRQMQKMDAVGQLTGGIAHDFNNMLSVVISGLQLLDKRLARGETDVQRYIDGALDGARRAAALTHRLLAFSRQQPLDPKVVEPGSLVAGMSELLTRALGERIETRIVAAAHLWRIHSDPGQLENAVLNLAVNARDAMPDGGRLTIDCSNVYVDEEEARCYDLPAGEYVTIAVADTGEGMSEEVVARAFDPFFTTKGVGRGTGLGLSQVFGFVRQSGGHVKIESAVDEGTTVRMYLPRYYGEEPGQRLPRAIDATLPHGSPAEIILVVEDDPRVRAYAVEVLRDLGYTVVEAGSGADALPIAIAENIALLVTDVVMPVMTGYELAMAARAAKPELPVLFVSGYAPDDALAAGMAGSSGLPMLTKPFAMEHLARKVRAVIDGDG